MEEDWINLHFKMPFWVPLVLVLSSVALELNMNRLLASWNSATGIEYFFVLLCDFATFLCRMRGLLC